MPLNTVGDYITQARILTQDTIAGPYRYPDQDLADIISQVLLEVRRVRPDLMVAFFRASADGGTDYPDYQITDHATDDWATPVPIDIMYRSALLYYLVGKAMLRDDETEPDRRSATLLNKFLSQLTQIVA